MPEVLPIPWKGVTVSEQRQRFLEDYQLSYYSVSELAERFSISRKTAHKWINRFKEHGRVGFHEHSRLPLPAGVRRTPGDLAGEEFHSFQRAF